MTDEEAERKARNGAYKHASSTAAFAEALLNVLSELDDLKKGE